MNKVNNTQDFIYLARPDTKIAGRSVRPAVTDEEAQTLIDEVLIPLLSGNLTITAEGTDVAARASRATVALTPEQLAALTRLYAYQLGVCA